MSKLYFILTFAKKNHYEFICMLERTGSRKVGSIQTGTSNLNNTTNVPSYYNYIYIWGSKWGFKWSQVLKLSFETKFTQIFYLSTKLQLWEGFFFFGLKYILSDRAQIVGSIPKRIYWIKPTDWSTTLPLFS